ncbi:MAG: hypothetical protein FJ272_20515, partial [Planctomycetes bacterium]|nr:hypothetical protein [Planctomycetota bacterium]
AHTGKFSAFLKAVAHERGSLNIGLVVGDSDGYKGDKAHPAEPGATYQYRFWAKGDFKEARLGLTTWKAQPTDSKARQFAKLATFMPTAEWKEVKGEFKMPSDAKRFVLLFQVYLENLGREPLGVLYMDDVEVSAGKANLIKNAGAENE